MKNLFLVLMCLAVSVSAQTTPTARYQTVADMVAAPVSSSSNIRVTALVTGRNTANDGGGGMFFFVPESVTATNLGTIHPSVSSGRWFRDFEGPVNVRWFGAYIDGTNNDTAAVQNAIDTYTDIYVPEAVSPGYLSINGITIGTGVKLSVHPNLRVKLRDNSNTWLAINKDWTNGNPNIVLTGGFWDGNSANQVPTPTWKQHGIQFRNADNVQISNLSMTNVAKFALRVQNSDDLYINNVRFNTLSDAIHINGPANRPIIKNVWGTTGDDTVAICADDWPDYRETFGDVLDVLIDGVHLNNALYGIRLLGSSSADIGVVTINNVDGTVGESPFHAQNDMTTGMHVDQLIINNYNVTTSGNKSMFYLGALFDDVVINNVSWTTHYPMVAVYSGDVTSLRINNSKILRTGNTSAVDIYNSTVQNLFIDKASWKATGVAKWIYQEATGIIGHLTISDTYVSGGTQLFFGEVGGAKTDMKLNSVTATNMAAVVTTSNDLDLTVDKLWAANMLTAVFRFEDVAKTARIRLSSFIDGGSNAARISKGTAYSVSLASTSPDFYLDPSILTTVISDQVFDSSGNFYISDIAKLTVGTSLAKISARSGDLAFNRDVATGSIQNSQVGAFQFHHAGSTDGYLDRLYVEVYQTNGTPATTNAMYIMRTNGAVAIGNTQFPLSPGSVGQVLTMASTTNATWQAASGGSTIPYITLSGTAIDLSLGSAWIKSVATGETYTFSNAPASGSLHPITIRLINSSGGDITPAFTGVTMTVAPIPAGKYGIFVINFYGDAVNLGNETLFP